MKAGDFKSLSFNASLTKTNFREVSLSDNTLSMCDKGKRLTETFSMQKRYTETAKNVFRFILMKLIWMDPSVGHSRLNILHMKVPLT